MAYQMLTEDGTLIDAYFDIDGNTIIFHGRSATEKSTQNADYTGGLRLLVQQLTAAGHRIQKAWVDSNRVQGIPVADRVILDDKDTAHTAPERAGRAMSPPK